MEEKSKSQIALGISVIPSLEKTEGVLTQRPEDLQF